MEGNETPHPDYLKGFNEGYLLAKHLPEVVEKVSPGLPSSLRSDGFNAGREQFAFETKEKLYPTWLSKDRLSDLNKDQNATKEKEQDKDEPEPEI